MTFSRPMFYAYSFAQLFSNTFTLLGCLRGLAQIILARKLCPTIPRYLSTAYFSLSTENFHFLSPLRLRLTDSRSSEKATTKSYCEFYTRFAVVLASLMMPDISNNVEEIVLSKRWRRNDVKINGALGRVVGFDQ